MMEIEFIIIRAIWIMWSIITLCALFELEIIKINKKGSTKIQSAYLYLKALTVRQVFRKINNKIKINKRKEIMRKRVIDLALHKDGLENYLTIKVVPEIESYFKRASVKQDELDNIEVSGKWVDSEGKGLVFYKKNEKLSGKVQGYGPVMDNFGNGLTDDSGRINLALLRIVGISEGDGVTVKTDDLLGYEETKMFIEQLGTWTAKFYEEHLRDQDITASVTFEV